MITIRRMPGEDIGLILDLDGLVFPADAPPILTPAAWWIAHDDGGECGYAGASVWDAPSGPVLYLSRAGVLPRARGQGLQRRFIRARERWARSIGLAEAYTYTHHASLSSANNLIACGYRLHKPDDGGPDRCMTPAWLHWKKVL